MRKILKSKLFKQSLIYGMTNAIYSGLPLILLPFLVVILEPEEYGKVDLFRSLSSVFIPILGLSAVQSISRFYFDLDEKSFKEFVSSIQIFQLVTSIFALIILYIFKPLVSIDDFQLIFFCILYFFFNQFTESLLIVFRVKDNAIHYLYVRTFNIIVEIGLLTIFYFIFSEFTWILRVLPTVIACFLTAIIAFLYFKRFNYHFEFNLSSLKKALIYSLPLVLHMLSGYILNIGDRFLIRYFLNDKELGNYAVAYQIGVAISFFYTSFNLAWTPTFFRLMKEKKIEMINKVRILVYISMICLAILILFCWIILSPYLLSNSNYNISLQIIFIILIAYTILSFYKFESNFFMFNKNTKKLSFYTALSAGISILLNILLIPRIGILGSAYSALVSFSIIFLLVKFSKHNEEIA